MAETPILLDPLPNILKLGSLNLLAGASGIGKTALLSWLLRQFELGAPIFGHATNKPPAIGFLTADRSWKGNRHWFDLSGVTDLTMLSLVDDASIKLPNQRMKHLRVSFFKECVGKMALPPCSLLVVDPIALFLGGNLLDYDTVAFACIEIQRWLQELTIQYATIGVCHSSKQKADKNDRYLRLQDRISGTMAQLGYTSTQMFLAGPEETGDPNGMYSFLWNPHTAPGELFQFPKGNNGLFLTDMAHSAPQGTEAVMDSLDAFDLAILAIFPADGAPLSTHAIVQHCGGDATTRRKVFASLKLLALHGLIVKLKHGTWARKMAEAGESPA